MSGVVSVSADSGSCSFPELKLGRLMKGIYIYSLKFVCFGLCCGMDRCSATVRAWLSSKSGVAVPEVPVAGSGRVLNHHSASLKL